MAALVERYRERLPLAPTTPVVTLGEGGTPLVHAPRLSRRLGLEVWLKCEGANPTGSFKDRGMTVAISQALADGAQAVICASTGNTAASAAAYAARAGLTAVVLQPEGAVALGKLAQARVHGARLLAVRGSFDEALAAARELAARGTHVLVNSLNPYRLEGQKTAAFEIVEELGRVPDVLALPYGGGGNTRAYATGFAEGGPELPRIVAAQSTSRADTVASAIRIVAPAHERQVREALARTGGSVVSVSDDALVDAWRLLAQEEGVFCEPASAAPVAALSQLELGADTLVVCVITGHGLKDPEAAERLTPAPVVVAPDPDAIAAAAR
jgi:threonine synthase